MGLVTFQIVDGLERGLLFENLATPVNIGREEDNQIRLNDERVSRFHTKVQEQEGKFILTDLDSTNGTRVNGHPVTMHVLRIGDQVQIGRCLLVYGSPGQLAERAVAGNDDQRGTVESLEDRATVSSDDECPVLFRDGPPPLPERLSGIQTAQTEDVLAFVHNTLLRALYAIEVSADDQVPVTNVEMPAHHWHRLQQLQTQLAAYLRQIGQPSER